MRSVTPNPVCRQPRSLSPPDTRPNYRWLLATDRQFARNREEWLHRLTARVRGLFSAAGFPLPVKIRSTCGFPSKSATAGQSRRIGECWSDAASKGRYFEILISPLEADPRAVAGILVHELCHTAVGVKCGHRGRFGKVARAVGLEGKLTATVPGDRLKARLHALIRQIGPYPHAKLLASNGRKAQRCRMLKVECVECGCVVRMTRKWLEEAGAPTCGCGGEMEEPVK